MEGKIQQAAPVPTVCCLSMLEMRSGQLNVPNPCLRVSVVILSDDPVTYGNRLTTSRKRSRAGRPRPGRSCRRYPCTT